MDEKQNRKVVDETFGVINQEPIELEIIRVRPRWYQRKITKFTVKPLTLGVLYQVTRELNKINITKTDVSKNVLDLSVDQIQNHLDNYIRVLAYALNGRDQEPPRRLLRLIRWNVDSHDLLILISAIISLMDSRNFCNSTILARGMSLINPGE